jgi:hypothetical protein
MSNPLGRNRHTGPGKRQTQEERNAYQRAWRKRSPHWYKYMKMWRKANPEKCAAYLFQNKRRRIEKQFGISPAKFDEMIISQNGKCALCDKPIMKRPCMDHDHKTGKVRAILCLQCNSGLGHFEDSIQLVEKALVYLRKHST